ncbi:MAG: triose-phosphate isomerase [bacterium]
MKKMLIAGNWKMNTNAEEAKMLVQEILNKLPQGYDKLKILVCPPFINIPVVSEFVKDSGILLGAQNCSAQLSGAFTGEISVPMLKYYGCEYVIIGHSERRQYYHETNKGINEKLKTILNSGLNAIVCIGETLEERQTGKTWEILECQLRESLYGIETKYSNNIVIAYEPVWAIGTGVSAETGQVQEAHEFIRNTLRTIFNENSNDMVIQYGGSVNDKNAKEILSLKDVNGALIGGASLKPDSFVSIIESAVGVLK